MPGFPIRKSWDHRLFAPPPSLSQLITSFIASQSLGIHRSLLFAFFILVARTYFPRQSMLCLYNKYSMHTIRLLYRIALLYYFFSLSFNISKNTLIYYLIIYNVQLDFTIIILLIKLIINKLFVCGSIHINCLILSAFEAKKQRACCLFLVICNSFIKLTFLPSYSLPLCLVENIGLEPMTPCVQGRCSKPTELIPRVF